jgi:RNA polymerase sigma-70 factor (ECF subfamily)
MDIAQESRQTEADGDGRLVGLTLSGDGKAYETLVRRYQKLVYNVLYQMVLSHETAADLTQETFLKAFKALGSFRQEVSFKPWLLRIASNTALNYVRDKKDSGSLDQLLEENPALEPPAKQDVEAEVAWRLSQAMLLDALGSLSARHRQFFILRYQHDLSYEEIATITGESETTIKSLLFRIREKLKAVLAERMSGSDL